MWEDNNPGWLTLCKISLQRCCNVGHFNWFSIPVTIIVISFASLVLEGVHKRLDLYKVHTRSQGNLEAKGEPRTTNTGQIM